MGFPGGSESKESTGNVGDLGSISGLGRFPGGGDGNRFRYSCLENPHGWRSLVSYSPWGLKESDVTKHTDRSSLGLPGGTVGKQPPASTGDTGSIPGSGRTPGGENGSPLQYSCLENSMDRRAWWATVHEVAKSQTQLSTHTSSNKSRVKRRTRNHIKVK